MRVCHPSHLSEGDGPMNEITTLAIDLAKSVFQLHGIDLQGVPRLRRQVRRSQLLNTLAQLPICLVAMEACASAHYWGRQIRALGHRVKLIPPQYVKPFVKGNKTDRNDAEAICEAALRPRMPSVALKSEQQQAVLSLHRLRELLEKQRKQLANQLRGLLGEFGIAIPLGMSALRAALPQALEAVPPLLRASLQQAQERLLELQDQCNACTEQIKHLAAGSPLCRRLMQEQGVGPLSASAFVATIGDPAHYRNGRQVSASLGMVPRQHSTGGKPVLLGISKRGDSYLRMLLIHGARAVLQHAAGKSDPLSRWLQQLAARRGVNRAVVALANKNARRLWAIWRAEGAQLAVEAAATA
jgi:transposase